MSDVRSLPEIQIGAGRAGDKEGRKGGREEGRENLKGCLMRLVTIWDKDAVFGDFTVQRPPK
jgi:hypothetical protein